MKEQLINNITAELAIQKGFNYHNLLRIDMMGAEILCTQSILQKWLRDVHNKHIQITAEYYKDGVNWNVQVLWPMEDSYDYRAGTPMWGDNGEFSTYEEALEFGLIKTLNLI